MAGVTMTYLDHEPARTFARWHVPPIAEATGPLLDAARALVRLVAEHAAEPRRTGPAWQVLLDWTESRRDTEEAFLREVNWRKDVFLVDGYCVRVIYHALGRAEAVAVYPRATPLVRSTVSPSPSLSPNLT